MNVTFGISFGNTCSTSLCAVASNIVYIINFVLVPVLFAIAFIVFLYGVFKKYIWSRGDEGAVEEGHKLILWGIIGFVVMVSLWGLVNVVSNTFGLAGFTAPPTPSSVSPYGMQGGSLYGQQQVQYVECPKDASGNCL